MGSKSTTCTSEECASATCKTHGAAICTNTECQSKNCRVHGVNTVNAVCNMPQCQSAACPIHGASATIDAVPVAPPAPAPAHYTVRPLDPYSAATPIVASTYKAVDFVPTDRKEDMPSATSAKSISEHEPRKV
jgi:hypothetical protein